MAQLLNCARIVAMTNTPQTPTPSAQHEIAMRTWAAPQDRASFEETYGVPLSAYAHEFGPADYYRLLGLGVLAQGVAVTLNQSNPDARLMAIVHEEHRGDRGAFSGGHLILGAASRALADYYHSTFTTRINDALARLGTPLRVQDPYRDR